MSGASNTPSIPAERVSGVCGEHGPFESMRCPECFPLYEIHVEPESGWFMGTGERWYGARFKYRPLGSRGRWSKFLATSDAPHDFDNLSIEQMQAMCRRHAEGFTHGF